MHVRHCLPYALKCYDDVLAASTEGSRLGTVRQTPSATGMLTSVVCGDCSDPQICTRDTATSSRHLESSKHLSPKPKTLKDS